MATKVSCGLYSLSLLTITKVFIIKATPHAVKWPHLQKSGLHSLCSQRYKGAFLFSLTLHRISMADEAMDTCRAGSFFPKASLTQDGWSTKEEATSTCYCGAVQLCFVSSQNFLTVTYISSFPSHYPSQASFSPLSAIAATAAKSQHLCLPRHLSSSIRI